jgi:hypothetical protein
MFFKNTLVSLLRSTDYDRSLAIYRLRWSVYRRKRDACEVMNAVEAAYLHTENT